MLRRILLSVSLLCLVTTLMLAQGSISGVVKDAKSGESIVGANVIVQGTQIGATTDIDGNFIIPKIGSGTYTLQVSFITYKTHLIPDVIVENAKKTSLTINLSEDVTELKEVVVQGTRQMDTDFELLRSIKEAKLIVTGVTAEQISRTLDRDAAQVLRRVPGVTIKDNQFIQIRGLSERYNAVMLHNAYAPSVETDVRSFSFATIPSSQLDRMLIYKSPAADIPGDFAGGVVKVFTKSIPDENSIVLDYSTQVRVGTTFNDFYHQPFDNRHNTGFNSGFYDLPQWFPSDLRNSSDAGKETAGRSLKNLWTPQKSVAIPDQRFTLTFNRKFRIGSVDIGNISAVNYSNTYSIFKVNRGDYTETNNSIDQNYSYTDNQHNQQVRTGFLFNWAFRFSDNSIIEFKNLYNQSSSDQYVDRVGTEESAGQKNGAFDKYYRGIYSGQLLGTHDVFGKRTTVEWVAAYNNSYRDQPDYKRYQSQVDGTTGSAQILIPNTVTPNMLGRFYSKLNEQSYSGGISAKQRFDFTADPLRSPELKAGVFFENKTRDFNARNLGYTTSPSFDYSLAYLSIGELFQPQNINNTTGIQLGEATYKKDSYAASNNLLAYYVMASIPVGKKIRLDAGARLEDNLQRLDSYDDFKSTPVNVKNQVNRLLPSANLSYNFTEKSLLRAAYGQTLNRPEFRELAPFSFFDFNFNFLYFGNPSLKTAKIQNIDLRWEYYPSKGEQITFGGFFKNFKDPIESIVDANSPGGGLKNVTFANAKDAKSYGLELEIKKSLSGLTGSQILNDINVLLNASWIKSTITLPDNFSSGREAKRPLQGQAPYVINAAMFYNHEESGWQVNLLYNVVGKSIVFVGNDNYKDVYLMPRNVLDLTFSKRLSERFQLKGGIADIINQPLLFLQDGNSDGKFDRKNDQTIQSYKPGQVFSIGFSWKVK
jgi:TonB-dependent receptor